MKTERWTGEMPCNLNGFRNFEFLIQIMKQTFFTFLTFVSNFKVKNKL